MLWGIDTASWAELWSGVIGSFVAAVIGGVVALLVVWMTKDQGSRQAEQDRQVAAIADLVAAAESAVHVDVDGPISNDPHELLLPMQSALIRLRISGADGRELAQVIRQWPHNLATLRVSLRSARIFGEVNDEDVRHQMNRAVIALAESALAWPDASKSSREDIIGTLSIAGEELEAAKTQFLLRPQP